jgi:hypothetical protein
MPRSDDKNERKRGPSRPKSAVPKKEGRAKAASGKTPPVAPRKKAASAPPSRKSAKTAPAAEAAPRARRAGPTAKPSARSAAKPLPRSAAKPLPRSAAKPAAPRRRAPAKKPSVTRTKPAPPALDEEQRIEDAKYQPRGPAPRLFEEERFVFPESYGESRVRLLVKDPEWLFVHWDVDPQSLADLRAELGERASALSKLTLRVSDPQHGGESRVLLPDGARSWYVRADAAERSYRAELGLTLPSGEFRGLAESNTVRTPRIGPAPGGPPRRARYDGVVPEPPVSASASGQPAPSSSSAPADPGPWRPDPANASYPGPGPVSDRPGEARKTGRPGEPSGGASDVYRR